MCLYTYLDTYVTVEKVERDGGKKEVRGRREHMMYFNLSKKRWDEEMTQ